MKSLLASVRRSVMLGAIACGIVVAGTALPVQAQPAAPKEAIRPPRANKADDPNLIINVIGLLIIGAAVLGASVIPSRRGHQD